MEFPMRIVSAAALAVTLVLAAAAPSQDAVTLKWKLSEGETFFAKNLMDMDMEMGFMGQNIELNMKMTTVQRFKVTSVKSDATTVEMTMESMEIKAGGLPGGIPGLGDVGDRVKGAKITATLNDKMEVTKLQGYEKFLDKLAGDNENLRKQMEGQFSEAAVQQMISQVFAISPGKPVKVGDTWEHKDKMPAGGIEATAKQKFKVESIEDGVAKIGVTGDLEFKPGDGLPGLPPGVKVENFKLKVDKFGGNLLFDTKAGRLKENKMDMNFNGSMTISAGGQELDMTMKIKAKQTTTVHDKNPAPTKD
jgi:hypothetical protein